ncbi:hypothetical protein BESB_044770 [Besnoitia besnoiti]|uniref:Calmodulin n=1 Tax=Besnoitia besnoiti TaxID=94643 RepID=A0A2A9ME68_BESBE|nr:hypothetical protein BESB_044770 [Besnoitia besnoiti]PFH36285.1 hypothetical protein BESB_044770 [Besnoitia besnoiti]
MRRQYVQHIFIARRGLEVDHLNNWSDAGAASRADRSAFLSPAGAGQAHYLGEFLREKGVTHIFAGLAGSSVETAALAQKVIGNSCELHGGTAAVDDYIRALHLVSRLDDTPSKSSQAAFWAALTEWRTKALGACPAAPAAVSKRAVSLVSRLSCTAVHDEGEGAGSVVPGGTCQKRSTELLADDTEVGAHATVSANCGGQTPSRGSAQLCASQNVSHRAHLVCGQAPGQRYTGNVERVTHAAQVTVASVTERPRASVGAELRRLAETLVRSLERLQRLLSKCAAEGVECAKDCVAVPEGALGVVEFTLQFATTSFVFLSSRATPASPSHSAADISWQARTSTQALLSLLNQYALENLAFVCDSAAAVRLLTHALQRHPSKRQCAGGLTNWRLWAAVPCASVTEIALLRDPDADNAIVDARIVCFAQEICPAPPVKTSLLTWTSGGDKVPISWLDESEELLVSEPEEPDKLQQDTEATTAVESDDADGGDLAFRFFRSLCGPKGEVAIDQAVVVAHSKGLAPSEEDLRNWTAVHGPSVKLSQLEEFLSFCVHPEDSPAALASGFAEFDEARTGYISRFTLVSLLMTVGQDPHTEAHVDVLLRQGRTATDRECRPLPRGAGLFTPELVVGGWEHWRVIVKSSCPRMHAPPSLLQYRTNINLSASVSVPARPPAETAVGAIVSGGAASAKKAKHVSDTDTQEMTVATTAATTVPAAQEAQIFVEFAGSEEGVITTEQACRAAQKLGIVAGACDMEAFEQESRERGAGTMEVQKFLSFIDFVKTRNEAFNQLAENGYVTFSNARKLCPQFGVKCEVHPLDVHHFGAAKNIDTLDYSAFHQFFNFVKARHEAFEKQAAEDKLDGRIKATSVERLSHIFGFSPSVEELRAIAREDEEHGFSYDEFVNLLASIDQSDTLEELRKAFAFYDMHHSGQIKRAAMARVLSGWGDGLTEDEINQVLTAFAGSDEYINYNVVISKLMQPSPIQQL